MPKISSRVLRRMIIAGTFLAIFSFTGLGLKRAITPAPSCTDGVMNGQEEGIDCGLFACSNYCEPNLDPPKVISTKLIETGQSDYDFIAEIENPHLQFGASEVVYEVALYDQGGAELLKDEGIFYMLPGQKKFLILTHLTSEKNINKIDFRIKSAKWQKLESGGLNLLVKNQKYSGSLSQSTLEAIILNDSDFDFEIVNIDVILYNSEGEIIAVNRSDIRTFTAGSERGFVVKWPFRIKGEVSRFEILPSTNLFENSNFIKRYGSGIEKFQEYLDERIF